MAKHSSTSNFKKLPLGFLLALMIIIIFESLNVVFDNYFYQWPYDGLRIKIKNELSLKRNNKLDFLVLGDCYANIGIIPKIIEGRTGLQGFNFATHLAYSIFSSYCFLKNYLRTCSKKPKYLIISFLPESCRLTEAQIEKDDFAYFYDFSKNNGVSFISEFGLKKSLPLMVPSLKHQYLFKDPLGQLPTFKSIFKNSDEIGEIIKEINAEKGRSNMVEDNIALMLPNNKAPEKFRVSGFFDQNLKSILNLADRSNITVIYIVPTRPSVKYDAEKTSGAAQAYTSYLGSLKKEYPGLVLLMPQESFDQVFSYSGELHLNFWGAMSLSDVIADKIKGLQNLGK